MPGFAFYLATRFPKIMGLVAQYWKLALAVIVAGVAVFMFLSWRSNLIETSRLEGRREAERVVAALVTEANARSAKDQVRLDKMVVVFGDLARNREGNLTVNIEPIIGRIKSEIAKDPMYRTCVLSDSVRGQVNSVRATVDTSIAASNPR